MQKFVYIQAHSSGDNGLGEINRLLEDGWRVVEIRDKQTSSDSNIELVVLIEKG